MIQKGGHPVQEMERMPQESGRQYALRILRDEIIRLELPPGTRLETKNLAARLGMSNLDIHYAVGLLADARMVDCLPRRGWFVHRVDPALNEDLLSARTLLESAVWETACAGLTGEQLERLQVNLQMQTLYPDCISTGTLLELDEQFHAMLYAFTGHERIWKALQSSMVHLERIHRMALPWLEQPVGVRGHGQLLRALRRRDAAAARQAVAEHMDRYRSFLPLLRQHYPDLYFLPVSE